MGQPVSLQAALAVHTAAAATATVEGMALELEAGVMALKQLAAGAFWPIYRRIHPGLLGQHKRPASNGPPQHQGHQNMAEGRRQQQ